MMDFKLWLEGIDEAEVRLFCEFLLRSAGLVEEERDHASFAVTEEPQLKRLRGDEAGAGAGWDSPLHFCD